MSGIDGTQGRAYSAGMQLHFNAINKAGGVNGHKFVLSRRDDGGRAEDTLALTRQLIAEERPLVLAGYFGSKKIADLVASGVLSQTKTALVGFRTSEIQPDAPYLYNVRAGLREEIAKLVDHLATIGITRLGLFLEAGQGAAALSTAAEEAANRANVKFVARALHGSNGAGVVESVNTMLNSQAQAIIIVTSGATAASFIERYRIAGGAAQLLAHSGADIEQLSKRLSAEQMQGVAIAQVTPSPYKVTSRLVKEFTDLVAASPNIDVPISYAMMEGYIAARVIVEAVRRQGSNATREGIPQALDRMNSFDIGGYFIG